MSGAEITSASDDASYAKANRKQLLADAGSTIHTATKFGSGQLGYATATGSGKSRDNYYNVNSIGSLWQPHLASLFAGADWGYYIPASSTHSSNAIGLLNATASSGSIALESLDAINGRSVSYTTGSSGGDNAGFRTHNTITIRSFNPYVKFWLRFNETTDVRYFIGFESAGTFVPNSDDPLNGRAGFGIGKITSSGNFRCLHNDGSGATISDDTGVAVNSATRCIELAGDNGGSLWRWNIDHGAASGTTTTEHPSAATQLAFQINYITTTGAKSMNLRRGCLVSIPETI